MKKWKRILAAALAAMAIAVMLPMGSVQALRMRHRVVAEVPPSDIQAEEEVSETENTFETEEASETEDTFETEEASETEDTSNTEETSETEDTSNTEQTDNAAGITESNRQLHIQITDDIQSGLSCENDEYVKKITHTIKLTRPKTESQSDTKIYDGISYTIYQKTDKGEISLKNGSLIIPNGNEYVYENKIEASYKQAGDYYIRIYARLGQMTKALAGHDFSIKKEPQKLTLKKSEETLLYNDLIYIDELVSIPPTCNQQMEYEIKEESGEKSNILEIGTKENRTYIKAIGINAAESGTTAVTIRLKETALMESSDEKTLSINVNPIKLSLNMQLKSSTVYLYDTLAVKAAIHRNGENIIKELLASDKRLKIGFTIASDTETCEIIADDLEYKEGIDYTFYIPIKREYFKNFTKGAQYNVTLNLRHESEYLPYDVNPVTKSVMLLGRRAALKLSAEQEGIYDYRTYYRGEMPKLFVEPEDKTSHQNADAANNALSAEAKEIVYKIESTNPNVVSADDTREYTASDGSIPFSINGAGTATLIITADGGGVYTVERNNIRIVVKDSPLFDTDFLISVFNADKTAEQSFAGDMQKTGFEKWQAYLEAHNGWINGSVRISLTESGLIPYEALKLTENGQNIQESQQVSIEGDKDRAEYQFYAKNNTTKADTKKCEDKENGKRSFQMGIDTTAPVIKSFAPDTDYFTLASTDSQQYFPKNYVLTGTFEDATSGIAAIEYTTDITAGNAQWMSLEKSEDAAKEKPFRLILKNGIYNAIAVRAVDAAGNVSEPVCLKNEAGAFIKVIVDTTAPDIKVQAVLEDTADGLCEYDAEGENWTNKPITFHISEKEKAADIKESVFVPVNETYTRLYKAEYAYQSIASVLRGDAIGDDEWRELSVDAHGTASLSIGNDTKNPINKNGCYYFRGISRAGIKSETNIEKRILLWQKAAPKKPVTESGADLEKCSNEWYNKASGTPILDFVYPEYDTGVISGEYAAPITIHYNLHVQDETKNITSLVVDKTATIRTDTSQSIPINFTGFTSISDDLSALQAALCEDGIYTLEYWITDAAGNKSELETRTYKVDCHEPTSLKIALDGEAQIVGNEKVLLYEKFYQNTVSGEASAEYGISGPGSIKLLKAKQIGDWKTTPPAENAEQFQVEPNTRCLLYIRAVDGAGNMAEGWTRGIAVDNEAPTGNAAPGFIIKPEGANKHGFFNKDVKVKINVKDAPSDSNSAGLKRVAGSVGTDETDTISDKELFISTEESVSESLLTETEQFSVAETINAKANEGNHAYITVTAADRCGNIATETQELKIDVTKPEITITFDNENAVNGRYYNADRRAQISIREQNFDPALVKVKASKNGEPFTPALSEWESDKENHNAYIDFTADGDYTLLVECKDLADNHADKVSAEPFTIDKTMPRVRITLESGDAADKYYHETQTAVITVTEHNFRAEDVQIKVEPSGNIGTWEHKNDTHVIKAELPKEGAYSISCEYKDLAGNDTAAEDKAKMPFSLVIDKTAPAIEISGVEHNSANAGAVLPNITVRDTNIAPESIAITLTTGRGAAVDIGADISAALTENGFLYTLVGLDTKPDDVYYLAVNAADKAGNKAELTYRFSLNRRGSAYDLTELSKLTDSYYNSYNRLEDIQIVEMNVDRVEESALYLSHNADFIYGKKGSRSLCQKQGSVSEAVLYNVETSGNEDTGYIYTYTVYRENFASEGTYRLGIYSKDRAGNEVNNLLRQNGEEIRFVIDNTMPRIVIDGVENNELYDVEAQEVRVVAEDNFKLFEAELMLVNRDNEVLERWNYFDLVENEGETARIIIGEQSEEVSLLYRAVDAAGNEIETLQGEKTAKEDFLVTTDKFVQLVNKPAQTPIGRGIIAVSVFSMLTTLVIFAMLGRIFLKKAFRKRSSPNE